MTDAELIKLAAKAAAINLVKDPSGVWRDCTGMPPAFNIFGAKPWNPLTDDGGTAIGGEVEHEHQHYLWLC